MKSPSQKSEVRSQKSEVRSQGFNIIKYGQKLLVILETGIYSPI